MTTPDTELLALALDAATGRAAPEVAPAAWLDYAREVIAERRAVLDAPACPTAFVRRAQALFAERPKTWAQRVLDLVFDSWAEPAAARRGAVAERTLRYEAGGTLLDVEVSRSQADRPVLFVAASADVRNLRVTVQGEDGASRAVRLDASGAGRIELPAGTTSSVVVLLDGDAEIARTPPMAVG